ncbi:MAG: hypothetical protein ACTSRG_24960 [Candidatus Helarchaeota archaeon]
MSNAIASAKKFKTGEINYLMNRIIRLFSIFSHENVEKFFQTEGARGKTEPIKLLKRLTELNRINLLYNELFEKIFQKIIRKIHFETKKSEFFNKIPVGGIINWKKTINHHLTHSGIGFPQEYNLKTYFKLFNKPENILLILTFLEFKRDCKVFLNDPNLKEELVEKEKEILEKIIFNSNKILRFGVFREIVKIAKNYLYLHSGDKKYLELIKNTVISLKLEKKPNIGYLNLLKWRDKYRDLNVKAIRNETNFMILARKDINKLFEIWILLEILYYLKKSVPSAKPKLKKTGDFHVINATIDGKDIKIFYQNTQPLPTGWALRGIPDFIFLNQDNRKLVLVDVKNYNEDNSTATYKMLGYFHNFEKNNGVLIFPGLDEESADNPILGTPYGMEHSLYKGFLYPSIKYEEDNRNGLENLIKHISDRLN